MKRVLWLGIVIGVLLSIALLALGLLLFGQRPSPIPYDKPAPQQLVRSGRFTFKPEPVKRKPVVNDDVKAYLAEKEQR